MESQGKVQKPLWKWKELAYYKICGSKVQSESERQYAYLSQN